MISLRRVNEVFENPDDKPYLSYARIAKDMIIYGEIDWDLREEYKNKKKKIDMGFDDAIS